ncbi:MAG TPA: farnesyl diphosphate synthase [Vicinamibacterales bacterium]|nr:farnesyl diphosphate synthase [Vicinamibacterales bacterium]
MTDLSAYLDRRRGEIDAALERILDSTARAGCPPSVIESMRYSVMAGGKRFRPVLTLASAEAVAAAAEIDEAAARDRALPAACAIELIHTYSLVHDDLPAMDNDTLRRGRPTSHVVFGEGMAILAGDGLLTLAFEIMGSDSEQTGSDPARRLRAIGVIARAAGATGMVGGQAIDLQAVGRAGQLDADSLRAMHARKTGALITAAAVSGAILAGAPDALVGAIRKYAVELGLAFQIVDDILDVEGEAAALGKTAGKDAAAGKPTYPALFGLDESRRMADACLSRATQALDTVGIRGQLADIARWVVTRSS